MKNESKAAADLPTDCGKGLGQTVVEFRRKSNLKRSFTLFGKRTKLLRQSEKMPPMTDMKNGSQKKSLWQKRRFHPVCFPHWIARKLCQSGSRWKNSSCAVGCTSGAGISARMSAGNINKP